MKFNDNSEEIIKADLREFASKHNKYIKKAQENLSYNAQIDIQAMLNVLNALLEEFINDCQLSDFHLGADYTLKLGIIKEKANKVYQTIDMAIEYENEMRRQIEEEKRRLRDDISKLNKIFGIDQKDEISEEKKSGKEDPENDEIEF